MYYIIILMILAADQAVKHAVRANMELGGSIPLIEGIVHITYITNTGGAFSLLQGHTAFLIVVTAALTAAIVLYIHKNRKNGSFTLLLALSLICGGGLGNLIDRARLGSVVDFIDFRVFPVFNVADICVCCGCGLLLIHMVFSGRREASEREADRRGAESGAAAQDADGEPAIDCGSATQDDAGRERTV